MIKVIKDRFRRKVYINVQGKDGNVTPFLSEQENLGFYKRGDPKTKVIELLYPINMKVLLSELTQLEAELLAIDDEEILVTFFFNGESYLIDGKIAVELGDESFQLENRINSFCKGANNVTIWAVWDCSRQVK